jgi:hypothetical protein
MWQKSPNWNWYSSRIGLLTNNIVDTCISLNDVRERYQKTTKRWVISISKSV